MRCLGVSGLLCDVQGATPNERQGSACIQRRLNFSLDKRRPGSADESHLYKHEIEIDLQVHRADGFGFSRCRTPALARTRAPIPATFGIFVKF